MYFIYFSMYKQILENPTLYKESHIKRGRNGKDIYDIIVIYDNIKKIKYQIDQMKRLKNVVGSHISNIKRKKITVQEPLYLNVDVTLQIFNM